MRTVFFDVLCGAAGDIILSSLIDLGVPIEYLQEQIGKLGLEGLKIGTDRQKRHGIEAAHLIIEHDKPRAYRHLPQILSLLQQGSYPPSVMQKCEKILGRLAQAEAKVHGIPVERVHFHEVGAIDTIVDILGVSLALDYLKIDEVLFSTLTEGHGTITVEHGVMPVPAPATAEMAQGFAMKILDIPSELLTPTGCAVLTSLGKQLFQMPAGKIERIGYGCGNKQFENSPNILRAVLLDKAGAQTTDSVCVLETDVDHISGEIMGFAAEMCLSQGALDVSWTPVFMKKGRPGYRLQVICTESLRDKIIDTIMLQTRTLGVRYHTAQRTIASRSSDKASFRGKEVAEKQCEYKGHTFKKLEYDALAALAREAGKPLIDLIEEYERQKNQ